MYGQDDKVSIQFDHVNGKPLKKETSRSTFVRAAQTLSDWFFKFDIKLRKFKKETNFYKVKI